MNNRCPCCSYLMLRHLKPRQMAWYCPHCHQEMPNFQDFSSFRSRGKKMSSKVHDRYCV